MIQQTKPVGAYQDNGLHKATLTLKNSAKKRQQVLVTVHAIAEEAGQTMTLLKANLLRLCAAVNQPQSHFVSSEVTVTQLTMVSVVLTATDALQTG